MSSPPAATRRRSLPGYAALLLTLVAVGVGYASFAPTGKAAGAAATSTSTQVAEGRRLFLLGCSSCHGLNAQGGAQAPSLIGVGSAAVDFQVGTGRMPLMRQGPQAPVKRPTYSQADVDRLAAYVASTAPGPMVPTAAQLNVSDADIAAGGELFRTNCASCHNFAGKGGALTGGKYAPNLDGVSNRHIYEAMLTGPQQMPVFGDGQISPQNKRDVIKFITTTRQEADPGGHPLGRLGPIPEGLVAFLVGVGGLVVMTLWIGARA